MQCWLLLALAAAQAGTKRFLLISSPGQQLVQYKELPDGKVQPLVTAGVTTPEGMVVQDNVLYIADPTQEAVIAFTLQVHDGHLIARKLRKVKTGVRCHWVAYGDGILYSDTDASLIDRVAESTRVHDAHVFGGDENLFTAGAASGPGGIAAMSGSGTVYWTNTVGGVEKGSVVAGDIHTKATTMLANPVEVAHGVCMSQNNVFFTADSQKLFGVKHTGGAVVEVSGQLGKPRGCVYDGDGTVYVADMLHGAVYSFPANMENLMAADLEQTAEATGAYGVALYMFDPVKEAAAKPSIVEEGLAEIASFLRR